MKGLGYLLTDITYKLCEGDRLLLTPILTGDIHRKARLVVLLVH